MRKPSDYQTLVDLNTKFRLFYFEDNIRPFSKCSSLARTNTFEQCWPIAKYVQILRNLTNTMLTGRKFRNLSPKISLQITPKLFIT